VTDSPPETGVPPATSEDRRGRRWLRRALVAVAIGMLLVALAVAALPWLARPLVMGMLTVALGRPVSIAALSWDVRAGSVVADDVRIGNPPEQIGVRRVTLSFDPRALDRHHLVIERVGVEAPVGAIALDEQLWPRFDGGAAGVPGPPIPVSVRELVISEAAVAVRLPESAGSAATAVIDRATLTDIALAPDATLQLAGELSGSVDGAPLRGTGTLRLTADASRVSATLSVAKLPVRDGMAALPAPLASVTGTLDATARLEIGDPGGRAEVALDLRLATAHIAGPPGVALRAARFELPAVRVDLAGRRVDLGAVAVREPALSIDLAQAVAPPAPAMDAGWSVRSGPVAVHGGEVRLHRGTGAVSARLDEVRWDGLRDGPTPLRLTAHAADGGALTVNGAVRAVPPSAELDVRADGLVLPPWARLLELPVQLARGTGSGTARIVYRDGLRGASGDVRVSDLHTLPPEPDRPTELLAVATAAAAFSYTPGAPATLELPVLSLSYPYAMIARSAAGTFPRSLVAGGADASSAAAALRIGRLDVVDGKVEYVDETLDPPFWTSLTGVTGTAERIAWPAATIERLSVVGKRDELSPVAVSGAVTPQGPSGRVELTDVLLDSLDAIIAPRLGYRFTTGRLSTVATAIPEPPLLVSTAEIVLEGADVLQTGTDAILAQSGVPLPIALSLISGPGGRISLTLPFSVDTRSGDVEIGSVVWQAARKAIASALTSPLRILGSLFGSGGAPHAFAVDPIPFSTGSATLDAAARDRVGEIARIVQAHAGLVLVLLPQITDDDLRVVGRGGATALAQARAATARAAFIAGDPGPPLPAARLLLAPWKPAAGAKATHRPSVYVELQDAS
jgi:hypothetical protein